MTFAWRSTKRPVAGSAAKSSSASSRGLATRWRFAGGVALASSGAGSPRRCGGGSTHSTVALRGPSCSVSSRPASSFVAEPDHRGAKSAGQLRRMFDMAGDLAAFGEKRAVERDAKRPRPRGIRRRSRPGPQLRELARAARRRKHQFVADRHRGPESMRRPARAARRCGRRPGWANAAAGRAASGPPAAPRAY